MFYHGRIDTSLLDEYGCFDIEGVSVVPACEAGLV